ncbi:hypothetical protein DUI87_09485 [Hirundo rustica rustica]|uniref:Uncharacterized protein n=1 Tax=Hirundo rustica rustica TaxID=333673 RepID=A0A3M0KUE0_HIRRU|nr:hypothetical protein DUI87_09485 [Hirundo rustica rustica]
MDKKTGKLVQKNAAHLAFLSLTHGPNVWIICKGKIRDDRSVLLSDIVRMDGRSAMDLNELDQDIFIGLSAQGGAQDPVQDPAVQTCNPGVGLRGELSGFIVVCLDEKETYASEPQF